MTGLKERSGRVVGLRGVAPGAFELTFERDGLRFRAGEEITVHGPGALGDRTYSLLGSEGDEHLRILFRVVPDGALSPWLAGLKAGDTLPFTGPHGNFILRDPSRPVMFVATGTGIAPAVSFVRTHPDLDMTLVHGVRIRGDLFYREEFAGKGYVPCVSREDAGGMFHGRVTDWFRSHPAGEPAADVYLCGANEMIMEMRDLLLAQAGDPERIYAEPYYFW